MDHQNKSNIYQTGYLEIFLKNFLVGVARGLGNLFIWFILTFIVYRLFWPQLTGQVKQITNLIENLKTTPNIQNNSLIPGQLNKLLNQYVPR